MQVRRGQGYQLPYFSGVFLRGEEGVNDAALPAGACTSFLLHSMPPCSRERRAVILSIFFFFAVSRRGPQPATRKGLCLLRIFSSALHVCSVFPENSVCKSFLISLTALYIPQPMTKGITRGFSCPWYAYRRRVWSTTLAGTPRRTGCVSTA